MAFQILEGLVGRGGGQLRNENVKYVVLNSQQGKSDAKHREEHCGRQTALTLSA